MLKSIINTKCLIQLEIQTVFMMIVLLESLTVILLESIDLNSSLQSIS